MTVPRDVRRAYRERWLPRDGRKRAAAVVLLFISALVVAGIVVTAAVTSTWTMLPGLAGLLPSVTLHPRGIDVAERALRKRNGLVRGHWVTWDEVLAVEPPGRWRDLGIARLVDGRVLELRGMAPDDVVRLAAALSEARAEPEGSRD
ncbi:hypothetical protein [Pseudokineococcus lusitanus]|uniref:hypothetical protein n=1 Tax=Pseudokineococcus lusitanus TaxID=763993 RepID=UPI000F4A23DD|nr:hypothetical protein [Pseudokineococcus lusitanus]